MVSIYYTTIVPGNFEIISAADDFISDIIRPGNLRLYLELFPCELIT